MNKGDFIIQLEKELGNRKTAETVMKSILGNISDALICGEDVRLSRFGIFKVADRKARVARNPRTGERMQVKAGKRIRFVPSQNLKAALN